MRVLDNKKLERQLKVFGGLRSIFGWIAIISLWIGSKGISEIYNALYNYEQRTVKVEKHVYRKSKRSRGGTITFSYFECVDINLGRDAFNQPTYIIRNDESTFNSKNEIDNYLNDRNNIIDVWLDPHSQKGILRSNGKENRRNLVIFLVNKTGFLLLGILPWLYFHIRFKITKNRINGLTKS